MKILKLRKEILLITSIFTVISCGSGSSSSSAPVTPELAIAVFPPNTSVSESNLWVATQPSTANWSKFLSGTTQSIKTIAANSNNILAFDGSNFILSNAMGSQFTKIPFNSNANSPTPANLVAGNTQFIMYVGNLIWNISDSGAVTPVSINGLTSNISSIVYLNNQYYAYTTANSVYSSADGLSWSQVSSAQNIQPFSKVIQLNSGLYAAMTTPQLGTDNPNLWLGTSPSNFNPANSPLQNFFGVPAQVNFIGSNGSGNLYINETVSFTQTTIREYFIDNASQVTTGAVLQVISLPADLSSQKPSAIYFTAGNIYLNSGTVAINNNPTGNLIDPNGPSALTAVPYVSAPSIVSQLVGDQSQTNGRNNAVQGNNFITAPGTNSSNNGLLTLINSLTNISSPGFQILPSGESASYAAVIGSPSKYILLLNNGGVLLNSGSGFVPATALVNSSNSSGSSPITGINSAASLNDSYLVQAASSGGGTNGDLYFSQGGSSWAMITQAALSAANLGTLSPAAITQNSFNATYNITTNSGTYQTATPSILSTWLTAPSPTPLFVINGVSYTLYPNSNNLGTLNGTQYTVTANALPQNYVSSGNVAYNESGTVALAQAATIVAAADKIAGTNYLWTAANLNSSWTLNISTFNNNGQALANEYFNTNPVLIWTGKIWVTQGNGDVLLNTTNLPTSVYTSNQATIWQAASDSDQTVMGTPFAF